MPSASSATKLEKTAAETTTAPENTPIRQAITIIEHKIRNLEKRKTKLESYRQLQNEGKNLNQDQKVAVAKYEEVIQTLDFAKDLCKQMQSIVIQTEKEAKKNAKKEVQLRNQQDLNKIRDVLLIQDILTQMGADEVREDFLLGRNGAVQISAEDLKVLDDLYPLVSPKHVNESEEGASEFNVQVQNAAEHLLSIVENKKKEVFSSITYSHVNQIVQTVHSSGYLDRVTQNTKKEEVFEKEVIEEQPDENSTELTTATAPTNVTTTVDQLVENSGEQRIQPPPDQMPPMPNFPPIQHESVNNHDTAANITAYQQQQPVAPTQYYQQQPNHQLQTSAAPGIPRVNSPITEVLAREGSFFFLQESEIDSVLPTTNEQVGATTNTFHQATTNNVQIPSQTFTNQNYLPNQNQQPPHLGQHLTNSTPNPTALPTPIMLVSNQPTGVQYSANIQASYQPNTSSVTTSLNALKLTMPTAQQIESTNYNNLQETSNNQQQQQQMNVAATAPAVKSYEYIDTKTYESSDATTKIVDSNKNNDWNEKIDTFDPSAIGGGNNTTSNRDSYNNNYGGGRYNSNYRGDRQNYSRQNNRNRAPPASGDNRSSSGGRNSNSYYQNNYYSNNSYNGGNSGGNYKSGSRGGTGPRSGGATPRSGLKNQGGSQYRNKNTAHN